MITEYHDFELVLTSHGDKKVSVLYELGNLSSDEPVKYEGELNPEDDIELDISELITEGRRIADVLFPTKEIRKQFRELWQKKGAIRLRLSYRGNDEQIEELTGIPWEYVYLSRTEKEDKKNKSDYLLGLRDEISIVHCLNKIPDSDRLSASVEGSKPEMKYFSYLGREQDDKEEDNKLFQNFIGEFEKLTTFINCSNIGRPQPSHIEHHPGVQPESEDVMIALKKDHLIHLTGHGETTAILMKDGATTLNEFLNAFRFTKEFNLKGIILLSCNSGDGHSIATALHKAGVPMVIGMTRTLHFRPAGNFVDGFYKALVAWPNAGLERAIVNGRESIFQEGASRNKWHIGFGLPRLFLNSPDSFLIPEKRLFSSGQMITAIDNHRRTLTETADKRRLDTETTRQNRRDLMDWIKQNRNAPKRRWYLAVGESGSGKSTQIALLLRELENEASRPKLTYHFCLDRPLETDDPNIVFETSDPLVFVRDSLVPQLARCFGEKKYYGWCPPGQLPLLTDNADDALINFVYLPLLAAKKENKKLPVIVIDGIDMTPLDDNRHNSILGLLLRHRDKLDDVARFLITADSIDDKPATEEATLIMEDIRSLTFHQNEPPDLIIRENSLFLFDKMVEENFKSLDIPQIPKDKSLRGLFELFGSACNAAQSKYKAPGEQKVMVNRLLDIVAIAYEPLRICDLVAVIGLSVNSDEMKELLQVTQPFFKDADKHQNKLILYHSSLKTYLLHEPDSWEPRDVTPIHELFVNAIRPSEGDWTKIADWSTLMGTEWQKLSSPCPADVMSRYVKRYLSRHAYQSYCHTSWRDPSARRRAKDFLNLICDPGFRTVHLIEVGQEAAIQDVWKGLRVVYTEYLQNLASPDNNDQARRGLDRLLAANESGSDTHNELIELEQQLRVDPQAGVPALFKFLDLDPNLWKAQASA
jgi:hypothetical protein